MNNKGNLFIRYLFLRLHLTDSDHCVYYESDHQYIDGNHKKFVILENHSE